MPYHHSKTRSSFATTLNRIEQAIYTYVDELYIEAWVTAEPVPFTERQSGEQHIFKLGQSWGKLWDCAWFHFTGTIPFSAAHQTVVLLIDLSGEACIFDDTGCPVLGLTTVSSDFDYNLGRPGKRVVPFLQHAQGGEAIDVWADAGCNDLFGKYPDSGTIKEAHIALCNEEMYRLYHDFAVLHELMAQLPENQARYQRIQAALRRATNELYEFTAEEAQRARSFLAPELAKTGGSPSLTISALGQAHIDLAWLWPRRETIRKGARTFSTVLALMERYPDYLFGASQPQLYQWMKEYYPALYEKIRARIAEGRWETQGAMWVEPDTNISGGEALVRQIIYGMHFFRTEFGTRPKMLWLPDVFGYTAALPQILKKAGIDYFLTIKISWNTFNIFPHHTFFWQGLDGSRVLTHMPPEGVYNSSAAPRAIMTIEKHFADKAVSERAMLLYGIGDGGGGPGTEHLERLQREKNLAGLSPVVQEFAETFFQRIAQESSEYQTWQGELYLERHQGTYTTQARNKRYNRKMELALRELEFTATLAMLTAGQTYPTQELATIWQEVLFFQFHDILPGSSITRVYDESLARYQQLMEQTQQLLARAHNALVRSTASGEVLTLFNSLSWERRTWLHVRDRWRYVAVPAMGYTTLDLAQDAAREPHVKGLTASPERLENDLLRVEFTDDGSIRSIFDKEYQREVLAPGTTANRLAVYYDDGDAWDFPIQYDEQRPQHFQLDGLATRIDGPQAIVEQRYHFGSSTLQQRIVLTAGSRRLDFVTFVDWSEPNKMLRTSFPVAISTTEATCEIQFGSIKRPTHRNTTWDMARYEVCAHKWVDLSQWDYGVALLNDCKYGHKLAGNVLDLNLLRSPRMPDPVADRAQHEFTYSLYPHTGNHINGGVVRAGYELNIPIQVVPGEPIGQVGSFVRVEGDGVLIEAIKKAEENDNIIIRLYEAFGGTAHATLTFARAIKAISRVNLLEEPEETLAHRSHNVELQLQPFEILTLSVQL